MSAFSSSTLLLVRSEFDGTNTSRKKSFLPRNLQIIYVIFQKYLIFQGRNVIHFSRFSFSCKITTPPLVARFLEQPVQDARVSFTIITSLSIRLR